MKQTKEVDGILLPPNHGIVVTACHYQLVYDSGSQFAVAISQDYPWYQRTFLTPIQGKSELPETPVERFLILVLNEQERNDL